MKIYADFDDHKLIKLFQEGDKYAFEVIYNRYFKKVCQYINKYYWYNDHETEDICQDIMVSIYKNLKNFKFKSKFTTYLYSATINHLRTRIRDSRKYRMMLSLDQARKIDTDGKELSLSEYVYDEKENIEDNYIQKELQILLREAVHQLPESHREVFILREFEKLGYNEIVEITGSSIRKLHYLKESADVYIKDYFRERNIDLF